MKYHMSDITLNDRLQALDDKFGIDFKQGIIDEEAINQSFPSQKELRSSETGNEVADVLDKLYASQQRTEILDLLSKEETVEKIEALMEASGKSADEISADLQGAGLEVVEKLDELLDKSQSQGFAAKIDAERKVSEQDPDKGDQGRG